MFTPDVYIEHMARTHTLNKYFPIFDGCTAKQGVIFCAYFDKDIVVQVMYLAKSSA